MLLSRRSIQVEPGTSSESITPAEVSSAIKALDILDSEQGKQLLENLRKLTK